MRPKHTRALYTKEFKSDTVKLVLEQGYSANEVARRLGVNKHEIFADVPNPSSAMEFGTKGISLQTRKPG